MVARTSLVVLVLLGAPPTSAGLHRTSSQLAHRAGPRRTAGAQLFGQIDGEMLESTADVSMRHRPVLMDGGAGEVNMAAAAPVATVIAAPEGVAADRGEAPAQLGAQKRLRALAVALQQLPRSATVDDVAALMSGQQLVQHNMTTLLLTFKRRHKWRVACLIAEWAERPDCILELSTMHYNLLISACSRASPANALDIFARMRAPRDVVTHNAAMAAALNGEDPKHSLEIFEEMVGCA
jgi:hypothetical protein